MPVVARSIQIQRSMVSARQFAPIVLLVFFSGVNGVCFGQEPGTAAEPPTAESAPQTPAADEQPAPVSPPAEIPAQPPVADACLAEVLAQQKLTRSIRELRNPLPRPLKADADKIKRRYSQLLPTGFDGNEDIKVAQTWLTYSILEATEPEFIKNPENMQKLIENVIGDVGRVGSQIGDPIRLLKIRKAYCAEILKISKQMLSNNLDARLAAVRIMGMLHDVKFVQGGAKAKIHPEALTALIAVMNDKEQPDSVKVFVATALRNVLRNCDVTFQDQGLICDTLAAQLARPCCEAGYQIGLLDTLLEITKARKVVGPPEPTAMKVFAEVLNDKSKPIEVRCHAAWGVGRGAFDPQMSFDPLAWKIATLARDVSLEYNRSPNDSKKWKACGHDLFFAFRHIVAAEATAPIQDRKGLLNRDAKSTVIAGAGPIVANVAVTLISGNSKFTAAQLAPLAQWIKANEPTNLKWDANAPPISGD